MLIKAGAVLIVSFALLTTLGLLAWGFIQVVRGKMTFQSLFLLLTSPTAFAIAKNREQREKERKDRKKNTLTGRLTGQLTSFFSDRGYGFITPDRTTTSVFVHVSAADFDLQEGQLLVFDVVWTPKGPRAANVCRA